MVTYTSFEIKEKEWIDLELKNAEFEYPSVKTSLSFDSEYFKIKATVHDVHFKDGDRSWRYGDGFFINFITKTNPNNEESGKFYAYGFSIIEGKNRTCLVNHNGIYYLSYKEENQPDIEVDLENKRAFYIINLPWGMLKPFHPLTHKTLGINIRYNSQNDDGSRKTLQLVEDEEFDSEVKVEKQYIPVHLTPSEKSKLQFAFKMENNLVQKDEIQTKVIVYSELNLDTTLRMVLRDLDENIKYKSEKKLNLKTGLNQFKEILTTPNKTSLYSIKLLLDDKLTKEHEFYRLNSNELSEFDKRLKEYGEKAKKPHEKSSFYGLSFKLNKLKEQIKNFDPEESTTTIEKTVKEIRSLLIKCDSHNHIYTEPGYIRTAFKSNDDETLQPYSLILPEDFDLDKKYTLLFGLHGSGVDEVGFTKHVPRALGFSSYLIAAPRGRDLSDWYIGQTERDVKDLIDNLKEMFNIKKIIAFGFSMGGYGVWRLTFLYPDLFEGAIVGSGSPYYTWEEKPEWDVRPLRKNARHIPYFILHGTEDRAIPFEATKDFVEQLQEEGFDVTFKVYVGAGHGNYKPEEAVKNWLEKYG